MNKYDYYVYSELDTNKYEDIFDNVSAIDYELFKETIKNIASDSLNITNKIIIDTFG